jgi:branched-chain amino acid transport system substrate-binding protein
VAIGQVGTFSGVGGTITSAARAAMSVWVKDVNARGGLACHPVQLFTEDDGGDPGRAAADVDELTARHHVIALVGNIVTFSVGGFLPAITSAKVPAVGGDDIAPEWFESPWMFPTGAGLTDQGRGIVKAGVAAGHRQFGLVYCVEVASCTEVDKDLRNGGTKSAGGKLLYDSPVSITQPDYTAQCLNARNAGVDLLGLALDGASMTRLARSCASVGYRPLLAAAAATFNLSNAEDPDLRSFGMVSESPVAPWTAQDTPAMRAFHAAMARYAPQVPPDGEAVLAWTSGALLEAAVAEIPAPELSGGLSPALIVEGLGRIHDDNLGGLTAHLTFAPGEQHALSSGCTFLERLGPGGWSTPDRQHTGLHQELSHSHFGTAAGRAGLQPAGPSRRSECIGVFQAPYKPSLLLLTWVSRVDFPGPPAIRGSFRVSAPWGEHDPPVFTDAPPGRHVPFAPHRCGPPVSCGRSWPAFSGVPRTGWGVAGNLMPCSPSRAS